eukprot:g5319.t1
MKASNSTNGIHAAPTTNGAIEPHQKALVLVQSPAVARLMSFVRAKNTDQLNFVKFSNRVMRLLVEEALSHLPHEDSPVETARGTYPGKKLGEGGGQFQEKDLCAVSIVRSGNTMLESVREVIPDVAVGHILVQRDESDPEKKAIFFYKKFPADIAQRHVLLCDPMLATGGSAIAALKCLVEAGKVPENRILFVNLLCAPEGVRAVNKACPLVKIVSAECDPGLNSEKFIVPGLGDFGDRYYNTA